MTKVNLIPVERRFNLSVAGTMKDVAGAYDVGSNQAKTLLFQALFAQSDMRIIRKRRLTIQLRI